MLALFVFLYYASTSKRNAVILGMRSYLRFITCLEFNIYLLKWLNYSTINTDKITE
jgi:hypothetical protein